MGKSFVTTTSTAIDNRLAVTDSAIGLSSSGTGNNINFQILDNGAVQGALSLAGQAMGGSLQFANNSLSMMLESIVNGNKLAQQSAVYSADTISHAMQTAAATQAAATAAVVDSGFGKWVKDNGVKLGVGAAAVAAAWFVWGRK